MMLSGRQTETGWNQTKDPAEAKTLARATMTG